MDNNSWMNNPALRSVDPQKLLFLSQLNNQAKGKPLNDVLPFLLSSTASMKQSGMTFSSEEFQMIFEVLKQGKTPEEIQKMNQMIQMFQMMQTKK